MWRDLHDAARGRERRRLDGADGRGCLNLIPIHELLARIRWDPEFGRGRYEIGYLDRRARRLVRVPLERIAFPPGERFAFEVIEDDGSARSVPYHRVREVWRDGKLIWSRQKSSS